MAKDIDFEITNERPSSDEISLRDLYLIFKRGLPIILGVALLLGVAAFVYTSLQPRVYEAESTTVISPSPINVQGQDGISFTPTVNVSYEAYQTLARSRPVMEATLAQFPELDMSVGRLRSASSLERLLGPRFPEQAQAVPLSVSHRIRHENAEWSAALSNAWTEATIATIRNSLLAGLGPVDEATVGEVQTLRTRLENAEEAWRAFQEQDETSILAARLERLVQQITDNEARLNELERSIAIAEARRDTLQNQLQTELIRTTSSDPTSDVFLAGLSLSEARTYLQDQLSVAERELQEARRALAEFDAQYNLPLLEAELDYLLYGSSAASAPSGASRQEGRSATPEDRTSIVILDETSTDQSLPAMYQRLRRLPSEISQVQAQLGVLEQAENEPLVATLQSRLAALQEELLSLPEEIEVTEARVQFLQEELVTLREERVVLQTNLSVRRDLHETILARAQQLSHTAQDPREDERFLRDSTPAVLDLQSELRSEEVEMRSLQVERDRIASQLDSLQERAEDSRREIALLNLQRNQLSLDLENARTAYQSVVRLQPTIAYVTQLAPLSARVLSAATVPDSPVSSGRLTNTMLAILLGGMLATLFVFLREAVSGASPRPEVLPRKDRLAPSLGND